MEPLRRAIASGLRRAPARDIVHIGLCLVAAPARDSHAQLRTRWCAIAGCQLNHSVRHMGRWLSNRGRYVPSNNSTLAQLPPSCPWPYPAPPAARARHASALSNVSLLFRDDAKGAASTRKVLLDLYGTVTSTRSRRPRSIADKMVRQTRVLSRRAEYHATFLDAECHRRASRLCIARAISTPERPLARGARGTRT